MFEWVVITTETVSELEETENRNTELNSFQVGRNKLISGPPDFLPGGPEISELAIHFITFLFTAVQLQTA